MTVVVTMKKEKVDGGGGERDIEKMNLDFSMTFWSLSSRSGEGYIILLINFVCVFVKTLPF